MAHAREDTKVLVICPKGRPSGKIGVYKDCISLSYLIIGCQGSCEGENEMKKHRIILFIIIAMMVLLTVLPAFASVVPADPMECPKCHKKTISEFCSDKLGRSNNPNWVNCSASANCLKETAKFWTGRKCTKCGYKDTAYTTHVERVNHKVCNSVQKCKMQKG